METGYYISQKDYDKIINYAAAAYKTMKAEIGGMAICYQDKDGDWIVIDPVIIKQQVTGGTCDLDKEALANYYCRAAKKHSKKNFRFCWWHSHHTMGVFWSSTDIKGINEYCNGDLSFALVVNLKRENLFRASMWKPVVMHEDTTLTILDSKKESTIPKKILKEVEDLCESRTIGYTSTYNVNNHKTSEDQFDLWDNSYDPYGAYAYNKMQYGISDMNPPQEQFYLYCWNTLCDWIEELTAGTLTYDAYKRDVDKLNARLVDLNSPYMFVLISKAEINEDLENADPVMWIRCLTENKEVKSSGVSLK